MTKVYVYDAVSQLNKYGTDAITAFAEGDEAKMMLMGLKRYTKIQPMNVKEARRKIAASLISVNDYIS